MDQPEYTKRNDKHMMPWHIKAKDAGIGKDCILVATMLGDEMVAVSLHVASLPDA